MDRIKTLSVMLAIGLLAATAVWAQEKTASEPGKAGAAAITSAPATKAAEPSGSHERHPAMKRSMARMDLNAATLKDLMKLPGIDEATANKIIAARPFKTKAELLDKKLVTKAEYSKLSSHVYAKVGKAAKEPAGK